MKIEDIFWKSEGLKIRGQIYIPEGPGPFPALLLCHGIPAKVKGPEDGGYPLLAGRFCRQGFCVLIFNFRGTGPSEGNFDIRGWARDLEGALDLLPARAEVDLKRVFFMGFSGGGAVAVYVAAIRPEVAGVVACASPAEFRAAGRAEDLQGLLLHARETGIIRDAGFPESLADWEKGFQTVRPLDWVDRIPPRPLLLIHGTADDVVDVSHARKLYARVSGKAELFLIEGAGHRLRVDERAMAKAEEWLKKMRNADRGMGNENIPNLKGPC